MIFNNSLDVRKLLPPGLLSDPLATGIARAFNTKNGRVVVSPAGNKVALTRHRDNAILIRFYRSPWRLFLRSTLLII